MERKCQECKSDFVRYIRPSHFLKRGRGKFCSRRCFHAYHKREFKGDNHWSWKDKLTYGSLHDWLHRKYGSANICENVACEKHISMLSLGEKNMSAKEKTL